MELMAKKKEVNMFKCQKCKCVTKHNEKCNKVVICEREKEYVIKHKTKRGKEYEEIKNGHEIVSEIDLCENCYKKMKAKEGSENDKI